MIKSLLIFLGITFYFIGNQSCASEFNYLTYENIIKKEGKFNDSTLENVISIYPNGKNLSDMEVKELFNSTTLINLRDIDLSNQIQVNDDCIELFSKNKVFSRVMKINLSGTKITDQSIDHILNSKFLGSIRDLPQISGRYGLPSSVIKVYANNTKVDKDTIEKIKYDFHIEYKPPIKRFNWEPVDHGIKIVEVETW